MLGNIFEEGKKPYWKTFRGAPTNDDEITRTMQEIQDSFGGLLTYFSEGWHICNELPSGGLGPGGKPVKRRCCSFEIRKHVKRHKDNRATALYALCWLGWYAKGAILHIGFQFPHERLHKAEYIEKAGFEVYDDVANCVYGDQGITDTRVVKFIKDSRSKLLQL